MDDMEAIRRAFLKAIDPRVKPAFFADLEDRSIIPVANPERAYFDTKQGRWIAFKNMTDAQIRDFYLQRYGIDLPLELTERECCFIPRSYSIKQHTDKRVILAMTIERLGFSAITDHLSIDTKDHRPIRTMLNRFMSQLEAYDPELAAKIRDLRRPGAFWKNTRDPSKAAVILELALKKDRRVMGLSRYISSQFNKDFKYCPYTATRVITGFMFDPKRVSGNGKKAYMTVLEHAYMRINGCSIDQIHERTGKNKVILTVWASMMLSEEFKALIKLR